MKLLKIFGIFLSAAIIFGLNVKAEDPIDAKKLFVDKKCNSCHSIELQGIEKTNKNSKAADLSNVGST